MRYMRTLLAPIVMFLVNGALPAADLLSEMQADNAAWLAAYNACDGAALGTFYTQDAVVLQPNASPVVGASQIAKFWRERLEGHKRHNHTFEIVSVRSDGRLAYQVAKFTVEVTGDNGNETVVSGNTVRIFERQADGKWRTKVHIWNTL